jgi:hypothetical protein
MTLSRGSVRCAAAAGGVALLLFVALSLSLAPPVAAQEPFGISSQTPAPPPSQGTEQAVIGRYWELGRPRLFLATMAEAGYAYVRPRFVLGYGQPYWRWVGIETYPLAALNSLGHYGGLSAGIPGLTGRVGARYTYPFNRTLFLPRESFTRVDIERREGPRADYLALEAELAATAPLWIGSAFAVGTLYRTELIPEGYYVYEDNLRVVMEPPYVWRARLGYLAAMGRRGAIRLGVASDLIGIPGRGDYVVRGGVLGSVIITASLEAQASFIPVLVSPDTIGLAGGDFGQLGIRFRWATGSTPDPERVKEALAERRGKQAAEEPIFVSPSQVEPPR